MEEIKERTIRNRRTFIKNSLAAAGIASVGSNLLSGVASASQAPQRQNGTLSTGDAAILRFLAAAEIIETDLWQQYNELGGVQDKEVPGGTGSAAYAAALKNLD